MASLRPILIPFSYAYRAVVKARNFLYDTKKLRSFEFDRPIISVGNLAVGGTGKTPMVEYLVEALKEKYQIATLSRGYGRKTKGYRLAAPADSAKSLGDEPYQYYKKWPRGVSVAVGEDRMLAITQLLAEQPATEIIVMDDAFQHRRVKPRLQILLSTFRHPFWKDNLLPAGMLRESPTGARRADLLVITKCPPELSAEKQAKYSQAARAYLRPEVPVLFSTIVYEQATPLNKEGAPKLKPGAPVILLTGLANPKPLEKHVKEHYRLLAHHKYSDHHAFSHSNLQGLQDAYRAAASQDKSAAIITSEKDAMRLLDPQLQEYVSSLPIYFIPIKMEFLGKDEATLWQVLRPNLAQTKEV